MMEQFKGQYKALLCSLCPLLEKEDDISHADDNNLIKGNKNKVSGTSKLPKGPFKK
jgi:hypothetical protein